MKTSELTGAALAYWVAQADPDRDHVRWERQGENWIGFGTIGSSPEFPALIITNASTLRDRFALQDQHGRANIYEPHKNWAEGGPLIENERIDLTGPDEGATDWWAYCWDERLQENWMGRGETPLIAAMRAFCGAKFGHEVPDNHEAAQPAAE